MHPSADDPRVNVVIANRNGGKLIENCLRSLLGTEFSSFDITVVDNASSDGSPEMVVARFPEVKLIRLSRNLGYAAANNIGIRAVHGEYLVLLNSDTQVEPDWLAHLMQAAERTPDAASLQPKILFLERRNVLNSAGNEIHIAGFGVCRGIGTLDVGQYDDIASVGYASGACMMIRRDALREVGLLDELFFAYGEDKDWGWRARMCGYRSLYVPAARVYHRWSAVLGRSSVKMYYLESERLVSICKNYSKATIVLLLPVLFVVEVGVLIHAIAYRWFRHKILAYACAWRLRGEVAKRRKQLSLERKISDKTLIQDFIFELQHPYLGTFTIPLDRICRSYRRLILS
jgi:GT2 family glycosyltransferase